MPSTKKPKILALTGGIGAGKTTVASHFSNLGAKVLSADMLAREVVEPGTSASAKIREEFGEAFFDQDGTLNRQKLGELIFSDEEARKRLENITHPQIRSLFDDKIAELSKEEPSLELIVYEIPLLFESRKKREEFDAVLCVYADPEICISRIVERDGLSEDDARKRINAQLDPKQKASLSDFVIDNSQELGDVISQVSAVYNELVDS